MRRPRAFFCGRLVRLCLGAVILSTCAARTHAQANPAASLPAGDGRDVLASACSQCHALAVILRMRDGAAGWKASVDNMILRGAQASPAEEKALVDYLAKNFGPGTTPMVSGPDAAATLPGSGPGKDLVQERCMICHDAGRIVSTKRSKQEWQSTIKAMMTRFGADVSASDLDAMSAYLATNFGKR